MKNQYIGGGLPNKGGMDSFQIEGGAWQKIGVVFLSGGGGGGVIHQYTLSIHKFIIQLHVLQCLLIRSL